MSTKTTPLLAVDPGGTTGWVVMDTSTAIVLEWGEERDHEALLDMVWRGLVWGDGFSEVVIERFVIYGGRAMSQQPDALKIIGALEWMCHWTETPAILQAASDAKRFGTPERLKPYKEAGVGKGGAGHAHMALSHGLLRLTARNGLRRFE